jgi:hypothetical protein
MSYFKCYKYRSINKNLIDSLVNSTLYFASRDKLNDPFDSRVDIAQLIENLLNEEIDDEKKKELESIKSQNEFFIDFENGYKDFGICSLSMEADNTLMWSHYADEHRGVALYFDMPESFLNNPDEILGVSSVKYEDNTISNWLLENAHNFEKDHFEFVTKLLKIVLTAKSPAWHYEKEGRIIRPKAGVYEIPRDILKGIVFGLRTSEKDENLIRSIAGKYYGEIQYSRATRSGSDFGIEVK